MLCTAGLVYAPFESSANDTWMATEALEKIILLNYKCCCIPFGEVLEQYKQICFTHDYNKMVDFCYYVVLIRFGTAFVYIELDSQYGGDI